MMILHHHRSSSASASSSTWTSTSTESSSFSSSFHPTYYSRFRRRNATLPTTFPSSSIFSLLFLLSITFPFSHSSLLYPFDGGLGTDLQGVDQLQIAAYGDFNSDKETDVFIIGHTHSNNTDHYHVWCYFQNSAWFQRAHDVTVTVDQPIEQIVPGDFNHDGALDLLIMTHTSISSQYQLSMYYGHFTTYTTSYLIPNMTSSHVLVLDINNDLRLDLFGMNQLGERAIWLNSVGTDGNVVMTMNKQELPSSPFLIPTLAYPHSSAFTDLNGDCLSDLIIPTSNTTHSQLEIWINHKAEGMKLERVYEIPYGMGAISVADVNGDGTLDILFPICWPRPSCSINASIHIIYNNQKPMCSSVWESSPSCRSQTGLCEADDGWTLGLSSEHADIDHIIVDHKAWNNDIFTSDMTLRMGDIDLDGYPDIIVTLMNPTTFTRHISILHNDACSSSTCTQAANNADRRTFSRYTYGTEDLESLTDATISSWLDIGNDGNLDVLVTRNTSQGMTLHTFRNNYQVDAYFLTTLGSNGVCPAWCPSGARFPSPKPYGVNHPGISIKLTVTDLSGSKSPRQGTQLSQSTHFALQMPYNIFGLGRTNNYIEEFFVGVPLSYSQHWQSWVAIIPNAQLIIFPWEPDTPSDWTLELFISPSSRLRWVIAAWLTCIGALVLTIAFFHWRERQADREEMKRNELLFAF